MDTITQESVAGTLESSDAMVYVFPNVGNGCEIVINSTVGQQFAPQIRQTAQKVLNQLGVDEVLLQIEDKGALDYVLQARIKAALLRAGIQAKWEELL
ncbi:citrate lyase acyl carrier protein [Suttonella ornithocola]|uniref:Citrate lyase gamma chain n=1 Tax=Suttonella ornithocola TaxID=279832 RepID=A0A380MN47_9GAMM|nr:citrate lyase acyl carrier protein [Suttonella ornithocola]SUO93323.1 Citrate lyase gamma chain [Suttonella ornithocola]